MQTTQRTPAPATPVARQTRRDLDVLAAVAVILVIVGHFWLGRVSAGVDVLLVLAGYYVGARVLRPTDGSVGTEIWWCARRVIPALVLLLSTAAGLTLLVQPQTRWEAFAEQTLAGLGFYQNWWLSTTAADYVQAEETVTPLQHLWALSVAAQVLLVLLLLARLIRRRAALFVVVAALAIGSAVWAFLQHFDEQTLGYYNTFGRAWELLAGVLAAFAAGHIRWPNWLRRVAFAAGLIAVVGAGILADGVTDYPGPWALVPVLATVLVILAGSTGDGAAAHAGWAGWAFALYLWHWPLLIFWMAHTNNDRVGVSESTAILLVAVAAAWATWRCVDTRWWPAWHPILTGTVTACLIVALAVGSLGWRGHVERVRDSGSELVALTLRDYPGALALIEGRKTPRLPFRPTGLEAPDDVPPTTLDKCLANFSGEEVVTCVYGDPHAARTIALAGGSHSEHWVTALHQLGRQHGFRVVTYLKMGCPLTTAEVPIIAGPFTPYPSCRTWSDNALAQLVADRPDYVFLTTTRPVIDGPGDYVPDYYLGVWDELTANGIAILGMRDTPWMLREGRFFSPVDCLSDGGDADTCGLAREEALRDRNPTLAHVAAFPGMHLLDLSDAVCRPTICRAVEGNVLIYHDTHHLSGTYVRTMADELGRQLADATGWW